MRSLFISIANRIFFVNKTLFFCRGWISFEEDLEIHFECCLVGVENVAYRAVARIKERIFDREG